MNQSNQEIEIRKKNINSRTCERFAETWKAMKRKSEEIGNIPQPPAYARNVKELLSSLPDLNRSDLINFIGDAKFLVEEGKRFLSLECWRVVSSIPNDVWKEIFLQATLSK